MGVPSREELEIALAEAARMREQGEDPDFVGKSLLNHHYRLGLMEDVLVAAKRYLHSGESSRAHSELQRAIDRAERAKAVAPENKPAGGPL